MDKFLQQLHNEIEKLKKEHKTVDAKIRALKAAKNTYIKEEGLTTNKPIISPEEESRADKIERIIKQEGHALHYKKIVKLLEDKEGYKFKAKNPYSATTATLSMGKRFKRVRKGTYGLVKDKTKEKSLFDEQRGTEGDERTD